MPLITILEMLDVAAEQPFFLQVWIVPGSTQDFNDDTGEYSGWFIEDYLRERGVLLKAGLAPNAAGRLIDDVKEKFEKSGFQVVVDTAIND